MAATCPGITCILKAEDENEKFYVSLAHSETEARPSSQ